MRPLPASRLLFLTAALAALASGSRAETGGGFRGLPLLNPIFADHMVLQRGKADPFWGWAPPGRRVRVKVADRAAETVAGPDGRWQVSIAPPPTGGPYTVDVDDGSRVVLHDVLVGEVWLCGGQSNMELPLQATDGGAAEAERADVPEIRLCTVATQVAYAPAATVACTWAVCSPKTAMGFSAVAYYFGRRLEEALHVPIGLVQDCSGGSPAESWMSAAVLRRAGEFGPQLAEIARLRARGGTEFGSFLMHWLERNDAGGRGDAWAQPDFDDRTWKTVPVPGGFKDLGVAADPAVAWFRREIVLPAAPPAGPATIFLGIVDRMDTVYVNGHWVGASSWVENPRVYPIPASALKAGRNVVAVRVFKSKPAGGFLSPAATLRLRLGDGREIPLAGAWKGAVGVDVRPPMSLPLDFDNYPTMPAVLYNGMIAPLEPLAIAGAIWYQGEANAWRPADQYRELLAALIGDWRSRFGQGKFPFYIVQLPAFLPRRSAPGGTDGWTELRQAQADTVRTVPNTALAVTIDTGEADNIHPQNKRPVGDRLAWCALAGTYGRHVPAIGPTLRSVEPRPGALALHFDHADGGLRVRGPELGEFSVAGEDGAWHWAQAHLEPPDVVVVSAPEVGAPVAVRYAWQANPLATLGNGAGLPAPPFQAFVGRRRRPPGGQPSPR